MLTPSSGIKITAFPTKLSCGKPFGWVSWYNSCATIVSYSYVLQFKRMQLRQKYFPLSLNRVHATGFLCIWPALTFLLFPRVTSLLFVLLHESYCSCRWISPLSSSPSIFTSSVLLPYNLPNCHILLLFHLLPRTFSLFSTTFFSFLSFIFSHTHTPLICLILLLRLPPTILFATV
jgi:hypothetical protein